MRSFSQVRLTIRTLTGSVRACLASMVWGLRFYSQDTSRPNRISAYIWNPSGGEGAGAYFEDTLTPGEWMHIVAVYDPGDMDTTLAGVRIAYKNGVLRKGPPC